MSISYNDAFSGLLKVLQKCGLKAGTFTEKYAQTRDTLRVKASETVKKRRKQLHSKRKGYQDKNEEVEGKM